jgi:hypothetical protein
MEPLKRARSRKRLTQPRGVLHTTAPVPDPTAPFYSPFVEQPAPLPATRRMPVPAGLAASSAPIPLTRSSGYFSAFRTSVKERDSYEYQA